MPKYSIISAACLRAFEYVQLCVALLRQFCQPAALVQSLECCHLLLACHFAVDLHTGLLSTSKRLTAQHDTA